MTGMMDFTPPVRAKSDQVLDWRQWVSPEARQEIIWFMVKAFIVGGVLALSAAFVYARWSESKDKLFHCGIMVAACGFTMPLFATSVKLMLVMFYMNWHSSQSQQSMIDDFKELKDEAKPIMHNLVGASKKLNEMAERYAKDDVVKAVIVEAERLIDGKNGIVPRFERKIDDVVAALGGAAGGGLRPPVPGLLEKGIEGGAARGETEDLGNGMVKEGRPDGALQIHVGSTEGPELPPGGQGEASSDALLSEEAPVGARAGGRGGAPQRVPAGP